VIAANNQPLEDIIAKGKFREDLFYRLNVLPVTVPPLRQRREDIPLLVEHILNQASKPTKVSATAMAALLTFDWPGNIRQLENELLRAAVLSEGIIEPKHLSISTAPVEIPTTPQPPHRKAVHQAADDFERQVIEAALAEANNNVSLAAQRLNMNRTALHRRIRKLGIVRKK
jgi:transcriptional regulator with PAS, ATPase and Fis domain